VTEKGLCTLPKDLQRITVLFLERRLSAGYFMSNKKTHPQEIIDERI
jgi:hypothetical protein